MKVSNWEPSSTPMLDFMGFSFFGLIGLFVFFGAFEKLFGKQSIFIEESGGYYLTGFKWLAWKKRFALDRVRSIEIISTKWTTEDLNNRQIKLEADRTIKFGAFLPEETQRWMVAVLKVLLLPEVDSQQLSLAERISAIQNRTETI